MNDSDIVELFLQRDEEAIRLVSEKYGARMKSIAYRITDDTETAQECVNDAFLEVWKRIPPNEPREYLPAFLASIVRGISINRCKHDQRLKRQVYLEEFTSELQQCIPSSASIEAELDGKLFMEAVNRFLRQQPEEKSLVFIRRYFYLDKTSSIALRFGFKENKVRTMLHRMRKDLKSFLEKEELL